MVSHVNVHARSRSRFIESHSIARTIFEQHLHLAYQFEVADQQRLDLLTLLLQVMPEPKVSALWYKAMIVVNIYQLITRIDLHCVACHATLT